MANALTLLASVLLAGGACLLLGWRLARRRASVWYVRPHTPETLARMPLPEEAPAETFSVSQGTFVRSNLPGGGSRME
jgi:hypothetical protein